MTQAHRFKVDKLIRDNLPQIMGASGIQVFERVMEKDEYLKRLKDKLLEEEKEVIASGSAKEMREELADLLEVMLALAKVYGMEFTDIQQAAEQKRADKGGFDNRIYNAFVEIEAGNPSLGYYRARPDQYPEVK
jgi:predicted house-cleaning noncanonical NTP pyrophosphatase (MazG superfamily)